MKRLGIMDRVVRAVAALCIADPTRIDIPKVRGRYGLLEGLSGATSSLVLAALKFWLGLMFSSAGLLADAVHSLTDVASSAVVITSFYVATKPPDREHPFGHAKAEYIATLIVSLLMVVAGWELGQANVLALIRGHGNTTEALPVAWPFLIGLCGLILLSELQARFSAALGRVIGSRTLEADGWHFRSDALATGIVILGLAGRNVGLPWLDGIAGGLVGAFIVWTGTKLALGSMSPLLGETAPQHELDAIRDIAKEIPGVVAVHDLAVHKYGPFYYTAAHMEVSDDLGVHRMHELAMQLEMRVLKRFPGQCVVHTDPVNFGHPLFGPVAHALRKLVVAHPDLIEYRDLTLWNDAGTDHAEVELAVDSHVPASRYPELARYVTDSVARDFPALAMDARVKLDFSSRPMTA
jgi:cation diffusion facilitator family transporter